MKKAYLPIVTVLAICIFLLCLFSFVDLYADDYYYGQFFDDGVRSFFRMNVEHYKTFNGRVFVHILAEIVLLYKPVLYPCAALFLTVMLFFLSAKAVHLDTIQLLRMIALGATFMLTVNVSILRESLLWVSASFNYLYPTFMVVLSIFLFIKAEDKRIVRYIVFFLTGATTEQGGITFLAVVMAVFVWGIVRKDKKLRLRAVLAFVFAFVGVVTVFLSPATMVRVGRENSDGIDDFLGKLNFEVIFSRIADLSYYIFSADGAGRITAIFYISTGLYYLKRSKKIAVCAFLLSGMSVFTAIFSCEAYVPVLLMISGTVFQFIIAVRSLKHEQTHIDTFVAYLTVASAASVYPLIFTESIFPRTVFPYCVYSIVIISLYINFLLTQIRKADMILALSSLVVMGMSMPMLMGYYHNFCLSRDNLNSVRNTADGKAYFCMDYDEAYQHTAMYDDGFFYSMYRDYYGIDKSIEIYFRGENCIPIENGAGEQLLSPIIISDGVAYAPLHLIIQELGEEAYYSDGVMYISYKGAAYTYNYRSQTMTRRYQGNETQYDLSGRTLENMYLYIKAEDVESIFGIALDCTRSVCKLPAA